MGSRSMTEGTSWTVVTLLGSTLVFVSLVLIALDVAGTTRQVEPPPFLGDFVPAKQQVCKDIPGGYDAVSETNKAFHSLGWPEWPEPELVECDHTHDQAPDGVVRWHSCASLLFIKGFVYPPCPLGGKRGATYAQLGRDGKIVAVDIYTNDAPSRSCVWAHEQAHARGILLGTDPVYKTPHIRGAHTEKVDHLMGVSCGPDWTWMDRRPNGDWPYGEEL